MYARPPSPRLPVCCLMCAWLMRRAFSFVSWHCTLPAFIFCFRSSLSLSLSLALLFSTRQVPPEVAQQPPRLITNNLDMRRRRMLNIVAENSNILTRIAEQLAAPADGGRAW